MAQPTVLVTGAAGFTGRHFCAAARARGWAVIGLGHGDDETVRCDLTDAASVQRALAPLELDAVVHLAGQAFVAHGDAGDLYQTNLFGTLNLLQALVTMKRPPRRTLLASSANVYGTPELEHVDESVCPAPVNHYACSKLAMEHMARTWGDRLSLVIARPFNYTGVGQDPKFLIPKIVSHVHRRAPVIELGNLDVWREFGDVRDVVSAYLDLLDCDAASGQTVNVCTGQPLSLREVLDTVQRIAGHRIEVTVNPAFVRQNEVIRLCGNAAKLQALTGHVPTHGFEQTVQWMLEGLDQ